MFNCHDDIAAFHKNKVTLPGSEQKNMRERRNANRTQLKSGLKRDGNPAPIGLHPQGSYAHKTMVQDENNDYDIDDGVYFRKEDLFGPNGGDKSPKDAKEMVRKAVHKETFNTPPEVRQNCVRVYYNEGYHVDIPVYRKIVEESFFFDDDVTYEIASSEWKKSDPLAVTKWFKEAGSEQSPSEKAGNQLRRVVRLSKAFARSRLSWRPRIASGFMITTLLANESFQGDADREDKALYDSMVAMRNRLNWSLEIAHPTVDGEKLTTNTDDAKTKFLREKLDWAIDQLDVLFDPSCTREEALKAWDTVFSTTFFSERLDSSTKSNEGSSAAATTGGIAASMLIEAGDQAAASDPVDKRGGGRYA